MADRMNLSLLGLRPTQAHSVALYDSCKRERTLNLKVLCKRGSRWHGLGNICCLMARHAGHLIPWTFLGIGPMPFPLSGSPATLPHRSATALHWPHPALSPISTGSLLCLSQLSLHFPHGWLTRVPSVVDTCLTLAPTKCSLWTTPDAQYALSAC